jgi:uncharacterized protein (TIGR02284 family)
MSSNHDIARLDDLIVTMIDNVAGYEFAATHAASSRFATLFADMADQRRKIVATLQARSRALDGTPNDFGSVGAALHRAFEGMRHALCAGDAAIVRQIERGEDYLREEYDRAVNDERVSLPTLGLVRDCYQSVLLGQDCASRMTHALGAGG